MHRAQTCILQTFLERAKCVSTAEDPGAKACSACAPWVIPWLIVLQLLYGWASRKWWQTVPCLALPRKGGWGNGNTDCQLISTVSWFILNFPSLSERAQVWARVSARLGEHVCVYVCEAHCTLDSLSLQGQGACGFRRGHL